MGNEYTFQAFAEQNVETLNEAGVTKIVASCPHCFNTLANEYRDFGGRYEVMHHTELLAELLRDGRLEPVAPEATVTYHDSCYLARHNDVRTAPREIVARIGKPLEMARTGVSTFCCGAGGAHMWMEERGSAINEERVRQAVETGRGDARGRLPVLHRHAGRRRSLKRRADACGGRFHVAGGSARKSKARGGLNLDPPFV